MILFMVQHGLKEPIWIKDYLPEEISLASIECTGLRNQVLFLSTESSDNVQLA